MSIVILALSPDGLFEATVKTLVKGGCRNIHVLTTKPVNKRFSCNLLQSLTILQPQMLNDSLLLEAILTLSKNVSSKALIPVRIEDIKFIAEYHEELTVAHPVLVPNKLLLNQVSNKLSFSRLVESLGLFAPKTIALSSSLTADQVVSELGLPIISKPSIGEGGNGIISINNLEELNDLILNYNSLESTILQEKVSGQDVAITLLANEGVVFVAILRKRWFTPNEALNFSPMQDVEYFEAPWLVELGRKFVKFTNFSGIADFDLKVDFTNKKAWFLECDPRIMGTVSNLALFGVNVPKLLVDQVNNSCKTIYSDCFTIRTCATVCRCSIETNCICSIR